MKKEKLYFFVENFSNDIREEFFEKELPYLSEKFKKVVVIPLYENNTNLMCSESNVEVQYFNAFEACNRFKVVLGNIGLLFSVFKYEFLNTKHKAYYIKNFRSVFNSLVFRIAGAERLKEKLGEDIENAVFYSYWFDQWVTMLSLLKVKCPNIIIVSRAHGSDYKEEQTNSVLAFRHFQLQQINAILPVSEYAKKYLIDNFHVPSKKIEVSRLGLDTVHRLAPTNSECLSIVSCSSIIPLKRVGLIVDILRHIKINVKWTHFGDGTEMNEIKSRSNNLPSTCEVVMMGYIPNQEVIAYLKNNPVSFFLNVSKYEGIPVTLMEAARFGIPLIGTNVGGTSEIVTNQTGFLLEENFEPLQVAKLIEEEHRKGLIYKGNFRNEVRNYYIKHFQADTNYGKLSNFLTMLS